MRSGTLISSAVARVRAARRDGAGHQTTSSIVREMIARALRRAHRKWKVLAAALAVLLAVTVSLALWKISGLRAEKRAIDAQIARIESLLEKTDLSDEELARLAENLNRYEAAARRIETTMLYRAEAAPPSDPIARQIAALMAEFGAETYRVPPGFVAQVRKFIAQYQGPNRAHMEAALGESHKSLPVMRRILAEAKLPEDLAFVALVESAVSNEGVSSAGAAGIWQFTPVTARAYGLRVGGGVDERLDVRKSTRAACKLLRDLILEFGSGSSVMLALAAYNAGVSRVKQGIRRVSDPIQQRNFWHLYRIRALPAETREYVPKVIAAMIIARAPEKFGF
jgi:soluble lytic murein transglycosylase-like protein